MKKISVKEYQKLMVNLGKAEDKLMKYHERKGRYWVTKYHYFFSNSRVPCIYKYSGNLPCLYTEEVIKKSKKLPKSFNKGEDYNFNIYHFSPKGCPNLTMKDYVLCLAQIEGKYYFGRHKVGKCPHKKEK